MNQIILFIIYLIILQTDYLLAYNEAKRAIMLDYRLAKLCITLFISY